MLIKQKNKQTKMYADRTKNKQTKMYADRTKIHINENVC